MKCVIVLLTVTDTKTSFLILRIHCCRESVVVVVVVLRRILYPIFIVLVALDDSRTVM